MEGIEHGFDLSFLSKGPGCDHMFVGLRPLELWQAKRAGSQSQFQAISS